MCRNLNAWRKPMEFCQAAAMKAAGLSGHMNFNEFNATPPTKTSHNLTVFWHPRGSRKNSIESKAQPSHLWWKLRLCLYQTDHVHSFFLVGRSGTFKGVRIPKYINGDRIMNDVRIRYRFISCWYLDGIWWIWNLRCIFWTLNTGSSKPFSFLGVVWLISCINATSRS